MTIWKRRCVPSARRRRITSWRTCTIGLPVDTFDDDETISLTGEGQSATGSVTDSEVELSDGESA